MTLRRLATTISQALADCGIKLPADYVVTILEDTLLGDDDVTVLTHSEMVSRSFHESLQAGPKADRESFVHKLTAGILRRLADAAQQNGLSILTQPAIHVEHYNLFHDVALPPDSDDWQYLRYTVTALARPYITLDEEASEK